MGYVGVFMTLSHDCWCNLTLVAIETVLLRAIYLCKPCDSSASLASGEGEVERGKKRKAEVREKKRQRKGGKD